MGTSRSAAELAGKMNRAASTIPLASTQGVKDSSLKGKNTIFAFAASRGVQRSSRIAGRPWNVRYDVKGAGVKPSALLRITGAFPLVESDTPAHPITPRRARGRRSRRGARALVINGQVRASANHPGTRGKHIFRDAKQRIIHDTPTTVMGAVVTDLRKTFG
jgi:hypothetical protein